MNISSECTEEVRCREVDVSSSFCRSVYSEIEEVGWEHLVKLDHDLMFLSFRILDKKGRTHIMGIGLEKAYPRCPPSISADVPYTFNLEWSVNSRLKHVVQQFQEHLEKLQEFWCTLDNIDKSLWVVYPKEPSRATSCREINLGRRTNHSLKILLVHWRLHCQDPQMFTRMNSKLNVEYVMLNFFPLMKSLVLRVEVVQTIHVRIPVAVGPSIAFVLGIGCVPSQQQGSHLMFCLGIAPTVQIRLQSKSVTLGSKSWTVINLSDKTFR